MIKLIAYTDGSNTYNGYEYSFGGYGWVLLLDGVEDFYLSGGGSMPVNVKQPVTNNRAELLAIISVLEYVIDNELLLSDTIEVYSDSQLCVKCINGEWSIKKNLDLFARFNKVKKKLFDNNIKVDVKWIKGHAGHQYNEMADKLAGEYAEQVRQPKPTKKKEVIEL